MVCIAYSQPKSVAAAATEAPAKTLKIGTRGSPLAMAQAYLTKQLLQVAHVLHIFPKQLDCER